MAKPRKKRTASLKTIRENISHLRKMISRLEKTQLSVPQEGKVYNIKRFGSRLIIDGKTYKPSDLEKLSGKKADFRIQAIQWLEEKLQAEEYRRIQTTGKRDKITALSELEVKQSIAGEVRITTEEEIEFDEWINSGSDGWKKNEYYHLYGADTINKGDIRGFLNWKGYKTVKELAENEP